MTAHFEDFWQSLQKHWITWLGFTCILSVLLNLIASGANRWVSLHVCVFTLKGRKAPEKFPDCMDVTTEKSWFTMAISREHLKSLGTMSVLTALQTSLYGPFHSWHGLGVLPRVRDPRFPQDHHRWCSPPTAVSLISQMSRYLHSMQKVPTSGPAVSS